MKRRSFIYLSALTAATVGFPFVSCRRPDYELYSWPAFTGGGWHHMGTTRMSTDPKNGVVNANCKVHGISNLHIAGASCYVTAAAPNPTLTLVALTLRLSDKIKTLV